MAKSTSFYALRKGSTKSHTYQTYRGEQITKDRVFVVANPQTSLQMDQRLIVPLVANARAKLTDIVDHSFQGMTERWKNLQEFSRVNMTKGVLTVHQFVPKGAMDCGIANFIISRGSIPPASVVVDTENTSAENKTATWQANGLGNEYGVNLTSDVTTKHYCEDLINKNGIARGTQLTFVFERQLDGSVYAWTANGAQHTAKFHDFVACRFIVDPDADNDGWSVNASGVLTYKTIKVGEDNKSNITVTPGDFMEISADWSFTGAVFAQSQPVALGVIISRKSGDTWQRSSARMVPNGIGETNTQNDVLETYKKGNTSSLRYLNNGDENASEIEGSLIPMTDDSANPKGNL